MLDWLFYADQIIMKNSGETASVAIRTSVELKRYTEGNSLRIRSEMLKKMLIWMNHMAIFRIGTVFSIKNNIFLQKDVWSFYKTR